MITNTSGIVLHRLKYSDSSIIVHVYTEQLGKQTYLIYTSKANRSKTNLIQPLAILDMQVYHNKTKDLQKVKDFGLHRPEPDSGTDFTKSSIRFFIAEFLYKVLKENEPDAELFLFLENTIRILNLTADSCGNFHLAFLVKFSRFLGIFPEQNLNGEFPVFDLQNGHFRMSRPNHRYFTDAIVGDKIKQLIDISLSDSHRLVFTKSERSRTLHTLVDYFNLHLDRPGKMKTLDVLQTVFA